MLEPLVDRFTASETGHAGDVRGTEADCGRSPRFNIIRDVCIYVLVMELAERLCFYTFSGSMIIYLRDYLDYSQVSLFLFFPIIFFYYLLFLFSIVFDETG